MLCWVPNLFYSELQDQNKSVPIDNAISDQTTRGSKHHNFMPISRIWWGGHTRLETQVSEWRSGWAKVKEFGPWHVPNLGGVSFQGSSPFLLAINVRFKLQIQIAVLQGLKPSSRNIDENT